MTADEKVDVVLKVRRQHGREIDIADETNAGAEIEARDVGFERIFERTRSEEFEREVDAGVAEMRGDHRQMIDALDSLKAS